MLQLFSEANKMEHTVNNCHIRNYSHMSPRVPIILQIIPIKHNLLLTGMSLLI